MNKRRKLRLVTPVTAVVIACIAAATAASGAYLIQQFDNIVTEAPRPDSGFLREAFAAIWEMNRIAEAAGAFTADGEGHARHAKELEGALAQLQTRIERMEREPHHLSHVEAKAVLGHVEGVATLAGVVLSAGVADPETFGRATRTRIAYATQALRNFITHTDNMKRMAIERQTDLLRQTTFAAGALVLFFGLLCCAAVLLLRSEIIGRSQRRRAEMRAAYLADFDPLTGLPNRNRFSRVTRSMLSPPNRPILLMIGLDGFKLLNEQHGHVVGDAALCKLAERIEAFASEQRGVAARLGGDEFALLVPRGRDGQSPNIVCEDFLNMLRAPMVVAGETIAPRASIGVALAGDEANIGDLMKSADLALQEAKSAGGDRIAWFNVKIAEDAARRLRIQYSIPGAIRNNELEMMLQPQVTLADGSLHGFEALVRWRRDGALLPPDDFLGIAEESGQIKEIDLWVLRSATRAAANWATDGLAPVSISVNLSPLHFYSNDIVRQVSAALTESGLDPGRLKLEITETVLLEDWDFITATLTELAALGVETAIDDFGSGYSSFFYMRNLKVDEIKLDRVFVVDLETSKATQFILEGVADIAKGLGMRLVVEGIETETQHRMIRDFGAAIGQGYKFGAPLSLEEATLRIPRASVEDARLSG